MSERGVCICPECGCQFSDDQKAKYEGMALRLDWRHRPFYRLRVWRLSRRLNQHSEQQGDTARNPAETVPISRNPE